MLARMWRKIAIVLAVVAVLALAGVFYLWRQVTALPEWYTAAPASAGAALGEEGAAAPAGWVAAADGESQEVKGFHTRTKKLKPEVRKAIKASRASYDPKSKQLEAGVVADLGALPKEQLSSGEQSFIERARSSFPGLADRDVYIGVEGETEVVDGALKVGPKTRLRIGALSYSLADAAQKLGISQAALEKELNAELAAMGPLRR
jgi:hypothetical protein